MKELNHNNDEIYFKDDSLQTIHTVDIVKEMKKSYLDYSMSVIIGRALPDVRDGLKPVLAPAIENRAAPRHRVRIL